jgi:hypothetical protein
MLPRLRRAPNLSLTHSDFVLVPTVSINVAKAQAQAAGRRSCSNKWSAVDGLGTRRPRPPPTFSAGAFIIMSARPTFEEYLAHAAHQRAQEDGRTENSSEFGTATP